MNHGTYIGERAGLKGQVALLKTHPNDSGLVLAQFVSFPNGDGAEAHEFCFGWHLFSADEFELDAQKTAHLIKPYACPKCNMTSGNDWRQCGGSCPVLGSPHYNVGEADAAAQKVCAADGHTWKQTPFSTGIGPDPKQGQDSFACERCGELEWRSRG